MSASARTIKLFTVAAISGLMALAGSSITQAENAKSPALEDGIVKVKSAYPVDETISRLKQDIAAKGIVFFMMTDQSRLAADAGIQLRPSTLLIFGNPPLGTQFITSNPFAGLDWPVRLLVTQDEQGDVWAVYYRFRMDRTSSSDHRS
jgi:uncharacterized protein (DUF302 family)